jgi:hypothetical protein
MQANSCRIASCISLAMILVLAATANAAIQFDQDVTGGVIFGSGNFNGGFTVDRDSIPGLELGLRAHTRFPSPDSTAAGIMSQGDGVYGNFAALGFFTNGSLGGPRAGWNFDFSINSNYNGTGGNISGFTFLLNIDFDPSTGANFLTINPLTALSDNAYGTNLAQNSEQLNFFFGCAAFQPEYERHL